jgi:hypothetical protein
MIVAIIRTREWASTPDTPIGLNRVLISILLSGQIDRGVYLPAAAGVGESAARRCKSPLAFLHRKGRNMKSNRVGRRWRLIAGAAATAVVPLVPVP